MQCTIMMGGEPMKKSFEFAVVPRIGDHITLPDKPNPYLVKKVVLAAKGREPAAGTAPDIQLFVAKVDFDKAGKTDKPAKEKHDRLESISSAL